MIYTFYLFVPVMCVCVCVYIYCMVNIYKIYFIYRLFSCIIYTHTLYNFTKLIIKEIELTTS